jgi:hypothetical protein
VPWIPAFAGMTIFEAHVRGVVIPAKAGIHFHCLNRRFVNWPLLVWLSVKRKAPWKGFLTLTQSCIFSAASSRNPSRPPNTSFL